MAGTAKKRSNILMYTLLILAFGLAIIAFFGYEKYNWVFAPNVVEKPNNTFIQIPTNAKFGNVVTQLFEEGIIKDTISFKWLSNRMKFNQRKMRPGRYEIKSGWSNYELIRHLRSGTQATVKVILSTGRLPEDVAGKASTFIEADSTGIAELFFDKSFLTSKDLSYETVMSIFIPNTYEFYWNTSAQDFFNKMLKEHDKFWAKEDRLVKAEAINMKPAEVYTLASIIERETNNNKEKTRMAGVYMNRLRRGIPLQADPTCVFATRDFTTKRVTDKHTKFDSPYNTYMYAGLPPGPISMASISSIDAVLNAEDHDFIYFCAKGDGTGSHNFAKTLRGHSNNANIYARNLRKRGLR